MTAPAAPVSATLARADVPLAGDAERLYECVRLREMGGGEVWPLDMKARERGPYLHTLVALGLLEPDGGLTPRAHDLLGVDDRQEAFASILAASRVGRAWTYFQGVERIAEVDPDSAGSFLEVFTSLKPRDREEAGRTLSSWLVWCRRPRPFRPRPQALTPTAAAGTAEHVWPSSTEFPHNEAGHHVEEIVLSDLEAGPVLVVVGYAALAELIPFLSRQLGRPRPVRLLFGNEPFTRTRVTWPVASLSLADEVRQYWLEWGISILRSAQVLQAREVIESSQTSVRIAPRRRPLHAKVYLGESAVTIGSSNFTTNGLKYQSEANVRFAAPSARYEDARRLAEGFWRDGVDYKNGLLDLLDAMLKEVDWREAIGRACAELLEGRWAEQYLPTTGLAGLNRPLWPHQKQGIAQALWALHNTGSVLIADATGSGKTRMGAWLLRAAYAWRVGQGHGPLPRHIVLAPHAVAEKWANDLREAGLDWGVHSPGLLSDSRSRAHESLTGAVEACELLAVDEAHNYLNPDALRTQHLLRNSADNAILFTATPISRRGSDLLGLVDLLGADHFSPEALRHLDRLQVSRPGDAAALAEDREAVRQEIQTFMVRRTRDQLNAIVDTQPDAYRLAPTGRTARYPRIETRKYPLPLSAEDAAVAERIADLAGSLSGISRLGRVLSLTDLQREAGITEEAYLGRLTASAAALGRYWVLDCLRSSRAALVELVLGTEVACQRLAPFLSGKAKKASGGVVRSLEKLAGNPPEWKLSAVAPTDAPAWLTDPTAHRQACAEEAERYLEIARLAELLSDARERAKADLLARLCAEDRKVLAFDSHLLSLHVLQHMLAGTRRTILVTGSHGKEGKQRAVASLGLDADDEPMIALCSDALSEGLNLQKPAVLVHLDYPTVIREAEQRVGRIDRMDSPNDVIRVWFPDESGGFTPRRRDLLRERHQLVADLIGANLRLPGAADDDEPLVPEVPAGQMVAGDAEELFDAFRSVRGLVEEGGLVGPKIYARMRDTQDRVMTCAGIVEAPSCWGFFAVGTTNRAAPRWVFLDDGGELRTDLRTIAGLLQARLGNAPQSVPLRSAPPSAIDRMVTQLAEQERRLLPPRRQRLLELAERVLQQWFMEADAKGDHERTEVLRACRRLLMSQPNAREVPHLREVADVWSVLLRPFKQEALKRHAQGRKRWGLDAIEPLLLEQPVSTEALREAFSRVEVVPSIERRIVVMLIGMPGPSERGVN